jgi:hypothetical protein
VEVGEAYEIPRRGLSVGVGEGFEIPRRQVRAEVGEGFETPPGGTAAMPWNVEVGEAQISGPAASQEWAVQRVLYKGNTGLPRAAEQRLTEAAMSGDPDKLATQSFLLSGKYPRFADALQRQRDSLRSRED